MSITTGRGMEGNTDLLFGKKVSKSDDRVAIGGTLDELNAHIGVVRASEVSEVVDLLLNTVQSHLVAIMGELATLPEDRALYDEKGYSTLSKDNLEWVRGVIKDAESGEQGIKFRGWAIPGKKGIIGAAYLDVCRTITRRAEREMWKWDEKGEYIRHKQYLNLLSDFFWVIAREAEKEA